MTRLALSTLAAVAALSASVAQAAPATYNIDPTHTFVTFEAKHFGTSTARGRFDKKSGTIVLDKQARKGTVDITIETGSINTGVTPFDGHLKSKDFFNSEAFPTATFKSDKLVFDGEKVTAVEGTLTLLGKSQPVTLKAEGYGCYQNPRIQREVCGGDFATTIQRSAYGMTYGVPNIPDDVKLVIQIEAIKQ
ncbi:YceI family protein [uncultured Aquabacterium sp.]|jgi:polyisoprenoid-binding protein YceI|uniref:YceI family protein n=1 Tax=uncultured Aquabacterium sp. TaxID=158753 RepID=UPI00260C57D3|nr:YceI family protein [uncultured Aquabacterium sp.]